MVGALGTVAATLAGAIESPALRVQLEAASPDRAQQLAETARQALDLLTTWLGSYPAPSVTLVDASWRAPAPSSPGTVPVAVRWIEVSRDPDAERDLIAVMASHYWFEAASANPRHAWFAEALARYSATRAIDTLLERRQYWSSRYFGGFIPYAVRSLPLSPIGAEARGHILSLDAEIAWPVKSDPHRVTRAVRALFTLERFIGWPALQQGLMAFRAQGQRDGYAPAALAAVLTAQRGGDVSWFFSEAFTPEKQFDYAVESLTNEAVGRTFLVRVNLRRLGNGVFGSTDPSRSPSLRVVVAFEDGSEVIERWNGAQESLSLEYAAATPAVRAAVDPDAVVLLDRDPVNNVRRLTAAPVTSVSLRATAAWLTWLEDLVLTCLAII